MANKLTMTAVGKAFETLREADEAITGPQVDEALAELESDEELGTWFDAIVNAAYDIGYDEGLDSGYEDGKSEGYDEGWSDAYADMADQ